MAISFGVGLPRRKVREVADGTFFVMSMDETQLFCLKGGTEHQVLFAVLAQQGPEVTSTVPGWFSVEAPLDDLWPIESGLDLEFLPGPFGLPLAVVAPANGAIAVDAGGAHWLYLKSEGKPGVQYVNLATGVFQPSIGSERSFYQDWRITWRDSPGSEPVTITSSGAAPAYVHFG